MFADFDRSRRTSGSADEVALPAPAPLRREWAVISAGPSFAACLTGWARPPGFEAIWSVEPDVVRLAVRVGLALAERHAPELGSHPPGLADLVPDHDAGSIHAATAITNRIVAYLDRFVGSAPG